MNRYLRLLPAGMAIALVACNTANDITEEPDVPAGESKIVDVVVLDYSPAPGQFVNKLPLYTSGDTPETMRGKVQDDLCAGRVVTLGSFGGSVTLRLEKPIWNTQGPDFRVRGNAIIHGIGPDGRPFGSSEPGIVEVMQDNNGNGLPDDGDWCALSGYLYDDGEDVTVTYHEPASDATDAKYIRCTLSDGSEGWINRVSSHHKQPFFPQWNAEGGSMTFAARRLPDNGRLNPDNGQYELVCYEGYADAYPDSDDRSMLDISTAVTPEGISIVFERIDFVRITTSVLQANGPLGECSTEVGGIEIVAGK